MSINNIFSGLDEHLEKALYYYDLPGLAVNVAADDLDFFSALGWKNALTKTPLQKNNIFHMASITKLFVSTSILQLCEKGLMSLDGYLLEYLPQFKMADERYRQITIRQLLSHTSGMPDAQEYHWDKPETDRDALMRYVLSEEVTSAQLLWDPDGTRFAYSNMAYEILGAVIASVSGVDFEDYVEKNIFIPLGMTDSDLLTFRRNMDDVCSPHEKTADKHFAIVEHFPYNRAHAPSSTLTSSLKDMAIWGRAAFKQNIPGIRGNDTAWEIHGTVPNNNERICLAWFRREQDGYVLYGHEGDDDGFRSSFWVCPQLKLSITVCSNISGAPVKRINREVFDIIRQNILK